VVQFDNRQWQAKLKIVYYGPAVGGKTTCLQAIHRASDPERRTRLYSLNTATDRTLFFDLMSLKLGRIRGYELLIQLYTVPGQVQYQTTRKAVLAGADGVVFVADSQRDRARDNVESLRDLVANLRSHGMDPETIPLVYQYNKQDLSPLIPIEDLETMLNPKKRPAFPTIATAGKGVLEGFAEICHATVMSVADRLGVAQNPKAVTRLSEQVRRAMKPLFDTGRGDATADIVVNRPVEKPPVGQEEAPLSNEDLVEEAVQANVAMTDMSATLDLLNRRLGRQLRRLTSLHELSRALSMEKNPQQILKMVLKSAIKELEIVGASLCLLGPGGKLRPVMLHGFKKEPLLSTPQGLREAGKLLKTCEEGLLLSSGEEEGHPELEQVLRAAGFGSAIWLPLVAYGRPLGLLGAYAGSDRSALEKEDFELGSILASAASIAYLNARARQQLEAATTQKS